MPGEPHPADLVAAAVEAKPVEERHPEAAAELREGAVRTHEAIKEVEQLTGRVNGLLEQLHQATGSQLQDLDRTRNLAREVVMVFEAMTAAAREARTEALRQRQAAEGVQEALGAIGEGMGGIRHAADSSARAIHDLDQHTSQIGEIVKLIQDVADQTNLLSLNAAIEAARAGDAGRGFAVVAQEIRVLADRSRNATKEIQELVSKIQGGTEAAMAAMSQSEAEVNRGVATVESTRGAIEQVLTSFEGLSRTVEGFGERAEATTGQMAELVQAVEGATQKANQNNDTVRELAEAEWFSNAIRQAERAASELVAKTSAEG